VNIVIMLGGGDILSNVQLTDAVEYLPHILLMALVILIISLTIKDIIYGMRKPFLDPNVWQPLQLLDRKVLTHNTRRFRFVLPHEDQKLGLPVGQHISIKHTMADGTVVMRPYTPTSDGDARGFVDFVIKVYPEGKMSQAMDALVPGDTMHFKGPKGRYSVEQYESKTKIGMIAGGTGITPMYQVAMAHLKNPNCTKEFSLIFANVSEHDILLKDELDDLAKRYPDTFHVYYVLDSPPKGWSGGSGFVTADMISEHLPPPSKDHLILRCGPRPMMDVMEKHLNSLGYDKDQQFQF
jgi:cytochrome-b5 reductase